MNVLYNIKKSVNCLFYFHQLNRLKIITCRGGKNMNLDYFREGYLFYSTLNKGSPKTVNNDLTTYKLRK